MTCKFFPLIFTKINSSATHNQMAILKKDLKKITVSMPHSLLAELKKHLKNFALTDRSTWLIEAVMEKMAKEKQMLKENE